MHLTVAGKDRSADLGRQVAAAAARLQATASIGALAPEHSALSLRESSDGADYLRRLVGLLRLRHGLRTTDYYAPRAPGLRGRLSATLKKFLWKLLRYQHDRMAFQQNLVNELAIAALEFQQGHLDGELAELKARLAALERGFPGSSA
ncbi:MAG: hypothetical protein AB7V22_03490 [Kiritimatiellia bacterium]